MYNKSGGKVRLTFKLEQDQLWIGTKGDDDDDFLSVTNDVVCVFDFDNKTLPFSLVYRTDRKNSNGVH